MQTIISYCLIGFKIFVKEIQVNIIVVYYITRSYLFCIYKLYTIYIYRTKKINISFVCYGLKTQAVIYNMYKSNISIGFHYSRYFYYIYSLYIYIHIMISINKYYYYYIEVNNEDNISFLI